MLSAQEIIKELALNAHPEGGYFRESYRSNGIIPTGEMANHCYATQIYYLLEKDNISRFHRIKQDETWHYYLGNSAISIYSISKHGVLSVETLGNSCLKTQNIQLTILANVWFAAELVNKDGFALSGCSVAPGFEFTDFELASRETMLNEFPKHADVINQLT